MKPNIHPEYGELKITCSNGKTFTTFSTKPGEIKLDSDPYNHVAWNKNIKITEREEGMVARFNNKLGGNFFNEDVLNK